MTRSLKERYEIRRVRQLKEHVVDVDRRMILENKQAQLIMEALDQGDLDKVSAIVQKLDTIKNAAGNDVAPLTRAIEQAQAELNKFTAGGPIAKAWSSLKQKVGVDNPIVKITTFANALEQGFKQIPQILRNNGIDVKKLGTGDGNMRLVDAVARQFDSGSKMGEDSQGGFAGSNPPSINSKDIDAMNKSDKSPETAQKLKSIIDQIRKALAPSGIFGAFKKIPYINSEELAQALGQCQISTLQKVANAVRSGPQTGEVAADLKSNVTGGGDAQTKGTDPAATSTPTGQTSTSEPSKSTTGPSAAAPAGEKPTQGPGEKRGGGASNRKLDDPTVKDLARFIAKKSGVDPETTYKVLSTLNASEKLREVFNR